MISNPEFSAEALGVRLALARKSFEVTQAQAAMSLGIPRTAIVQIERGKRSVSTLEISQFAKLYRKPILYFFDHSMTEDDAVRVSFEPIDSVEAAVDAYLKGEVSSGWLRDSAERLGISAERLVDMAIARTEQGERGCDLA